MIKKRGQNFELSCTYSGVPQPQVKWFKLDEVRMRCCEIACADSYCQCRGRAVCDTLAVDLILWIFQSDSSNTAMVNSC